MASTKLIRKALRNKMGAIARQKNLKRQNFKPVIKKVDVEELKASFENK